jgi:hypothetical protein
MFYTFRQNNSFGVFVKNNDIKEFVIIEANSAREANFIAEQYGIYFYGCNAGRDCTCCGDRWYEVDESDADEFPSAYGQPIEEFFNDSLMCSYDCVIYYKDGSKQYISSNKK